MNIPNVGSQESVGVIYNYIESLYAEDGFKWNRETKFQTVTS